VPAEGLLVAEENATGEDTRQKIYLVPNELYFRALNTGFALLLISGQLSMVKTLVIRQI
jgi:hypothetical protein